MQDATAIHVDENCRDLKDGAAKTVTSLIAVEPRELCDRCSTFGLALASQTEQLRTFRDAANHLAEVDLDAPDWRDVASAWVMAQELPCADDLEQHRREIAETADEIRAFLSHRDDRPDLRVAGAARVATADVDPRRDVVATIWVEHVLCTGLNDIDEDYLEERVVAAYERGYHRPERVRAAVTWMREEAIPGWTEHAQRLLDRGDRSPHLVLTRRATNPGHAALWSFLLPAVRHRGGTWLVVVDSLNAQFVPHMDEVSTSTARTFRIAEVDPYLDHQRLLEETARLLDDVNITYPTAVAAAMGAL